MTLLLRARLRTDGEPSSITLDGHEIIDAVRRVSFELVEGRIVSHLELWANVDLEGEAAAATAALVAEGEEAFFTVGPAVPEGRVAAAVARTGAEVFGSFEEAAAYLKRTDQGETHKVYGLDVEAGDVKPGEPFGTLLNPARIKELTDG